MGFVVKNTTKCGLLDLLCPHICRGCGRLGAVLCECCKNDMLQHAQPFCPLCKNSFAKLPENVKHNKGDSLKSWRCPHCDLPFLGLWCLGWREGALEKLVEGYKYQSVRAMGDTLAELYDAVLPKDLQKVAIIPLPTISRHVRERGLDHTLTLAKKLARRRGYQCQTLLTRATNTVQVGAKVAARKAQASHTYALSGKINSNQNYLLLDDVWTTGSSMLSAAKVLRDAGAKNLYGIVLATSKPANKPTN